MKSQWTITIVLCWLLLLPVKGLTASIDRNDTLLSPLEKRVAYEINLAREAPKDYAPFLEQYKKNYHEKLLNLPNETPIITKEGVEALMEAVRFLRSTKPVPLLNLSKGMSRGARDHVKDLEQLGGTQHRGSDRSQPWDRVNRYGTWQKVIGENISFGHNQARNIVMSFIIDDGVPHRGHRKNIFNPDFRVMGVACGEHPHYKTICVITFAGGYLEK
ncbi:MAG: CAP domain-containing protein [Syntrophaceae bacterium]|nr:CAP domain-containing protein [Syntrophaceae bacterium]